MLELFPGSREWSIQVLRLIAQAPYGGADLGECVRTVPRIQPCNGSDWVAAWQALGRRTEEGARAALAQGHTATARGAFFRASAYYRQADFFLPGDDERKKTLFLDAKRCFLAGAGLHHPSIESIEVPFGAESYGGYFCHPRHPKGSRVPGVVMLGGQTRWRRSCSSSAVTRSPSEGWRCSSSIRQAVDRRCG